MARRDRPLRRARPRVDGLREEHRSARHRSARTRQPRRSALVRGGDQAREAALPTRAAIRQIATGWRGSGSELEPGGCRAPGAPRGASSTGRQVVVVARRAGLPPMRIAAARCGRCREPCRRQLPCSCARWPRQCGGPRVGWVRPDAGLPEVTVVAQPAETRRALRATATLVARLTRNPVSAGVTVDGVRMEEVANGAVDLYYGLVGGKLVVSDSAAAAERIASTPKALPAVSQLPGAIEVVGLPRRPRRPAARAHVFRALRDAAAGVHGGEHRPAPGHPRLFGDERPGRDDGHAGRSAAAPMTGPAKVPPVEHG